MSQIRIKVAGEEKLGCAPEAYTAAAPIYNGISRDGDRKRHREAVGAKKWGGAPEANMTGNPIETEETVPAPAPKNVGGRPLVWNDPEEIERKGEEYFKRCDEAGRPYTLGGLAMSLGVLRETLHEYEGRGRFSDIIKRLKGKVHESVEERLFSNSPTGAIFWLKCTHPREWRDNTPAESSNNVLNINIEPAAMAKIMKVINKIDAIEAAMIIDVQDAQIEDSTAT